MCLQVMWDPELHWVCPQRAVPAGQQHAGVCQKEETHQTSMAAAHCAHSDKTTVGLNSKSFL